MIVACTGHSENEYVLKAWRHSIDEILPKPTNLNILKEILTLINTLNLIIKHLPDMIVIKPIDDKIKETLVIIENKFDEAIT